MLQCQTFLICSSGLFQTLSSGLHTSGSHFSEVLLSPAAISDFSLIIWVELPLLVKGASCAATEFIGKTSRERDEPFTCNI